MVLESVNVTPYPTHPVEKPNKAWGNSYTLIGLTAVLRQALESVTVNVMLYNPGLP
ncbi:hypothetical protein SDC9_188360 [bioreactor metagenome]|uniref:Uncharacterized protein n=1 Tax=bioreactor metagenome TaxID=1076179 RepID=A0A645HPQ2_9ZZZZ